MGDNNPVRKALLEAGLSREYVAALSLIGDLDWRRLEGVGLYDSTGPEAPRRAARIVMLLAAKSARAAGLSRDEALGEMGAALDHLSAAIARLRAAVKARGDG